MTFEEAQQLAINFSMQFAGTGNFANASEQQRADFHNMVATGMLHTALETVGQ